MKKEEARQRSESIFCDRVSFFVSHSRASPRDALPSALRLPRPRCGLAMTQNWNVLIWITDVFLFYAVVFCAVSLRIVFQTFRSGNCFVSPQNRSDLSLRGGRVRPTRQSLTERFVIPERNMVVRDETEPKEPRNQSAAAPCRSFAPPERFETKSLADRSCD